MPTAQQTRTENIRRTLSGYRFFPATEAFLNRSNFPAVTEVAARIIERSRNMIASTHNENIKEKWNDIILKVSGIVQLLYEISEQAERNEDLDEEQQIPLNTPSLESQFEELQGVILSLPQQAQPENSFATTSSTIASVCFYLLVLSAAIAIGATFGAWYFGYLSASYFVNMLVSSLAYFDIPTMFMGIVAYGVYTSQSTPSPDLSPVEADVMLLVANCKHVVDVIFEADVEEEQPYERRVSVSSQ